MIVTVIQSFDHDGKRYAFGDTPNLASATANALAAKGLISLNGLPKENPHQVGGQVTQSSASPPAPVSPQPTLNAFDAGETPKKARKSRKSKKAEEEE